MSILIALTWAAGARGLTSATRRAILLGALTGCSVHVQVPPALYGVLAWLALESRAAHASTLARHALLFGATMLAFVAAGVLLHPYGPVVYVRSFLEFSSSVMSMSHIESWTPYWVRGVRYPGLIFPIAAATILAALHAWRNWQSWATPSVLLASIAAVAALAVRNTWPMPSRWYEVAMFMPFVYLALVSWTAELMAQQPRMRTLLATVILAAIGVNAAGLVGRLAQGVSQTMAGTTMPSGRRALHAELTNRGRLGVVGVEAPVGLLLEQPERACSFAADGTLARARSCTVAPRLLVTFEGRRHNAALAETLALPLEAAPQRADSTGVWHLVCVFRGRDNRRPPAYLAALSGGWSFALYERGGLVSGRQATAGRADVPPSTARAGEIPPCGVS